MHTHKDSHAYIHSHIHTCTHIHAITHVLHLCTHTGMHARMRGGLGRLIACQLIFLREMSRRLVVVADNNQPAGVVVEAVNCFLKQHQTQEPHPGPAQQHKAQQPHPPPTMHHHTQQSHLDTANRAAHSTATATPIATARQAARSTATATPTATTSSRAARSTAAATPTATASRDQTANTLLQAT